MLSHVLVKAPCEYTTGIIEQGCGQKAKVIRGNSNHGVIPIKASL